MENRNQEERELLKEPNFPFFSLTPLEVFPIPLKFLPSNPNGKKVPKKSRFPK